MRPRFAVLLMVSIMGLAACQTTQTGEPGAQSTAHDNPEDRATHDSSSPSSSWPSDLPRITDSVDVKHWTDHPCDVITEKQLKKLEINSEADSHTEQTTNTSVCEWGELFDEGINFEGYFGAADVKSIPDIYEENKNNRSKYFNTATIKEYPSIFFVGNDERDQGMCEVALGLDDKHVYYLDLSLNDDYPGYDESCTVLKTIAGMAVTTMTEGGS